MQNVNQYDRLVFWVLIIFAAVVLFVNLDKWDYWGDEIFSMPKKNMSVQGVLSLSAKDVHPPLFYILEYYWIQLFGWSETATRSMSAIFGFLCIFAAYFLGKKILSYSNLKVFLLLFVTSPFFIFYARMNRYYTLTGLICLIALFYFIDLLEKPKLWKEIAFWISALAIIYQDYVGFIFLFSLGLYYLWYYKGEYKRWLRFFIGVAVIFVFYLPWMSNLIDMTGEGYMSYPEESGTAEDFRLISFIVYNGLQTIIRILYSAYNFTLGETVYPWNPIFIAGVAGSFLLFLGALKSNKQLKGFWFFSLFLPFALYMLTVVFYKKVFAAANFALIPTKLFFLQPIWMMFLLQGSFKDKRIVKISVCLLLIFNLTALFNYFNGSQYLNPKYITPWKSISESFAKDYNSKDIVLTDEETMLFYLRDTKVKCYGLVGAVQYISEQEPDYKVHLVVRHRGEESIYKEGMKVKDALSAKYGEPDYKGYVLLEGMLKEMWNKVLGMDFDYYLEIFTYEVKKCESVKV